MAIPVRRIRQAALPGTLQAQAQELVAGKAATA